ncbi:hypothetical protein J0H33_07280 [bacterium]|nr:hypothetical protein [bacterium]
MGRTRSRTGAQVSPGPQRSFGLLQRPAGARQDRKLRACTTPHGGDLTGFLFVRGDQQTLLSLTGGEEFQRLEARSRLIVDNWGVVPAVIGEALPAQLAVYQQQIEELT